MGLSHALFRSDMPGERSVTWPFGSVDARFSYEPGDSVVVISVEASPELEAHVDTLIFVLQDVLTLDDDA